MNTKPAEPIINVGITYGSSIVFMLNGCFDSPKGNVSGEQKVMIEDGRIGWNGQSFDELTFTPVDNATFSIFDVTIGINFHWERKETQTFSGAVRFVVDNGQLCAINSLPLEDYLLSVISSEMSATASCEFLKAHAVISRSWLISQIEGKKNQPIEGNSQERVLQTLPGGLGTQSVKSDTLIRWYDREDHTLFDVCADDHCQRYQGITRASSPTVAAVIEATRGQVLMSEGQICDARFAKCCGGLMEEFATCWADEQKTYLVGKRDLIGASLKLSPLPLKPMSEAEAREWICSEPEAFCNTRDAKILSQVLNDYDQETTDFYRWTVSFTPKEVSELIRTKLGIDFGIVTDLIPVRRGPSGRLSHLRIEGTKRSMTIGKELEIRRALSKSHLFSSAFVVDKQFDADGNVLSFILHGAGWGHGAGLCQIGAAVMGENGYTYDRILEHYYPTSTIESLY